MEEDLGAEPARRLPPPEKFGIARSSLRKGCGLLLGAVLLLLLGWVLVDRSITRREEEIELAWAALGMPLETIRRQYPDRSANLAALRLEKLAAKLEIDLVPQAPNPKRTAGPDVRRFAPMGSALQEHLNKQLVLPDDTLLPLPDNVAGFLRAHRGEVDEIVDLLLGREPMRWEFDLYFHIPNLSGFAFLHRLLLADALSDLGEGRQDEAVRALRASHRLASSLFEQPERLTLMIAIAASREHAGVLRRAAADAGEWRNRFVADRVVPAYLGAIRYGSFIRAERVRTGTADGLAGPLVWVGRPVPRWTATQFEEANQVVVALLRSQPLCGWHEAEAKQRWRADFPDLSGPRDEYWDQDLHGDVDRILRLLLDRELTLMVLRARAGEIEAEALSETCERSTLWISQEPDGRLLVERRPFPPPWSERGLILPRVHRLETKLPRRASL
jgi:hypothetical protein